tara:strand:- start:58 stop:315 length:258 start_codon:yes stop_codon:yes gene_type:complete
MLERNKKRILDYSYEEFSKLSAWRKKKLYAETTHEEKKIWQQRHEFEIEEDHLNSWREGNRLRVKFAILGFAAYLLWGAFGSCSS